MAFANLGRCFYSDTANELDIVYFFICPTKGCDTTRRNKHLDAPRLSRDFSETTGELQQMATLTFFCSGLAFQAFFFVRSYLLRIDETMELAVFIWSHDKVGRG